MLTQEAVLGVRVDVGTTADALLVLERHIADGRPGHVSVTNTESLYFALDDEEHRRYIAASVLSVCDGVGVVAAGLLEGKRIRRLNGPTLMEVACSFGVERGWRHFLYGGRHGVAEQLAQCLSRLSPGVQVVGVYTPPFRELTCDEETEVTSLIQSARPDIVWVGLGLLKQERWIARMEPSLRAPLLIGVGAAFDFLAGNVKRAPKAFRTVGLEWAYRLCREPRMFVRNARSAALIGRAAITRVRARMSRC